MKDIIEEYEKYISSNKEILSVLPTNTKKNRAKYVEKVEELQGKALQIKEVIWNEISSRYNNLLNVEEDPRIKELQKQIDDISDIELLNELNTPFEKLGLDRLAHSLGAFFKGDLISVNQNIKKYLDILKEYGVTVKPEDFEYSDFAYDYMKVFFQEYENDNLGSETLKKTFENIYWKCPDIVSHIELNLRYIYYVNTKKIEKELQDRNNKKLASKSLDKNGMVKQYFDLNQELIKLSRRDKKAILDKFTSGEWRIRDFNEKEMTVLYDRLSIKDYYECSEEEQHEIDVSFGKLLNTLQEYAVYTKYKYIIADLTEKYRNKDSFKGQYEAKEKELRKKEQELLKENRKNKQIVKKSKNPLFVFFKKKWERKIYEFPTECNAKIKEIKKLYDELDEQLVNTRVTEFVDDNCSLKYMFKIATSFYSYAYRLVEEHYQDDDIDYEDELQTLIDFIDQPYKVMLNNVKLVEEPEIVSIISNRYKILNIRVEKEDLVENLDSLIEDSGKIVDFYNIKKSGLNLEDIDFIETVKPMMKKV